MALATAMLLAAPAVADSGRGAEIAAALRRAPVYVAPARTAQLQADAVGRLQLRIVHKDIGRVHIAVVPHAWADEVGGVGALSHDIDAELGGHGALLVVADTNVYVITSHEHSDAAAAGVRHAFDVGDAGQANGSLEADLRRSIDALADVDPGPSGDIDGGEAAGATPPGGLTIPGLPDANKIVSDVGHTIVLVVVLIILAILSPFLFLGGRAFLRARREGSEQREAFSDDLDAVRQERAALGDDIVDLDEATSGADVPAGARAAYERALDAYDRSEQLIAKVDSQRRLAAAKGLVADGRAAAAEARKATSG